jgi:hypothetical protein
MGLVVKIRPHVSNHYVKFLRPQLRETRGKLPFLMMIDDDIMRSSACVASASGLPLIDVNHTCTVRLKFSRIRVRDVPRDAS